jgi:hypothetical protein
MVCHANRGDGGHEEWQDAIPPLPMDVLSRATRHTAQPVWSRISRQVDRSPSAAFFRLEESSAAAPPVKPVLRT